MSAKLPIDKLTQITALIEEGLTNREIALYFGCHLDTVKRAIRRMKNAGIKFPERKMGRPKGAI